MGTFELVIFRWLPAYSSSKFMNCAVSKLTMSSFPLGAREELMQTMKIPGSYISGEPEMKDLIDGFLFAQISSIHFFGLFLASSRV